MRLDVLKLSHHGSAGSTSNELLDLLDCPRYLVSTSGASYGHPKPEAISRVVVRGGKDIELLFNYRTEFNEPWAAAGLKRKWRYSTVYPDFGREGLALEL